MGYYHPSQLLFFWILPKRIWTWAHDICERRFCPVVSPAAFWDKSCWILVGDRYHLWCVYTYCSKLFYPPRISLPFFICLVFPSISSLIKMCVFGRGPPVFLSHYISVVQKVKSTESFLYFDYKIPTWRYWKWKILTQVLLWEVHW